MENRRINLSRMRQPLSQNSSRGYAAIGVTMVIVSLMTILYMIIGDQIVLFKKQEVSHRARLDAESAINVFGTGLYRAYVLGSELPESINGDRYRDNHLYDYNSIKIYAPDPRGICFERTIAGSAYPICITLPNDLVVKRIDRDPLESSTYEVALNVSADDSAPFDLAFLAGKAALALKEAIRLPRAQALRSEPWDPGAAGLNAITFNVNRSFGGTFPALYTNQNCSNTTTIDCVKIKFCVRLAQNCRTDQDYIVQTYVFTRPPRSQLEN
jgi:hypothetical protein